MLESFRLQVHPLFLKETSVGKKRLFACEFMTSRPFLKVFSRRWLCVGVKASLQVSFLEFTDMLGADII